MPNTPDFDLQAAHSYFSAHCFNQAWDLIEKQDRSPEEDQDMLRLSFAALWHWTQRTDYIPKNASVGYWQLARIYALLGQAENARQYGQLCLQASQQPGVAPFYLGYAYEALARAEALAQDWQKAAAYKQDAMQAAAEVSDEQDRQVLLDDLATIQLSQ